MITLTLKTQLSVPLEAEVLSPDIMANSDHAAIRSLPVFLGKRQRRLDDFFDIDGAASDQIELRGDASKVKWIGHAMSRGRINIVGNAGMHLGSQMKGGTIEVSGTASDWVGAEMSGGRIHVHGNAGGQIGAAYRGSMSGMTGGTIIIGGAAGLEVGMRMKRGTIVVGGLVRDFAGLQMKGGTICLLSGAEIRTGAWMIRGTIVSLVPLPLLPTFAPACDCNPVFLRMLAMHLRKLGVTIPFGEQEGSYKLYSGDASVPGKGEIFIWHPRAATIAT
jgi:formylmethanofuran dehydrogenase subunit C